MLRTPKQDETVVIYETRKNRVSKAHTQVIDLRPEGRKYALKCVTHGFTVERETRLSTEAESHKSHEWCPTCKASVVTEAPVAETSEWDGLVAAMLAPKDDRMSADEILEIIGKSTAKKACEKKFKQAGK